MCGADAKYASSQLTDDHSTRDCYGTPEDLDDAEPNVRISTPFVTYLPLVYFLFFLSLRRCFIVPGGGALTEFNRNDSLLNTISLTREGGEMRRRQREATDTGEQVFGKALGNEEERQGEVENMEE